MNKLLTCVALCAATQASAATLEVSLFYPATYEADPSKNLSQEIVGFYRSIELSNQLFTNTGVNLTLKPTSITSTTSWTTEPVETGINTMWFDGSNTGETDVADVAVGIFEVNARDGEAQLSFDSSYTDYPNMTRKAAIGYGRSLGGNDDAGYPYLMAHEILHTLGVRHDDDETFNDTGTARVDGFGVTCASGYNSLLSATGVYTPFANVTLSGAADCVDAKANTVAFVNHYAPLAENWAATIGDQTLTVAALENVANQTFDVTVSRTNTASAETMTLYVAGGRVNAVNNSLEPITVNFAAGSSNSDTIEIAFADMHPIFEQAYTSYQSVYAVAVGDNEVSASTFDLMTVNTEWVMPETTDDDNAASGGSVPLWVLMPLGLIGLMRKSK